MFSEINTSVLPVQEGFDAWRRYLSREFHLDSAQTKVIGKGFFRAQHHLFKLGGLLLERMAVTPHAFSYTGSKHSETVAKNHVLVMVPVKGSATRTLGEQTIHLTPGNVYIIDRSHPGTVRFTRRFESISVYVSREKFEQIFPRANDFYGIECLSDTATVAMLAEIIQVMHRNAEKLKDDPLVVDRINDVFWNALAAMLYSLPRFKETQVAKSKNAGSTKIEEATTEAAAMLSVAAVASGAVASAIVDYSDAVHWLLPLTMAA